MDGGVGLLSRPVRRLLTTVRSIVIVGVVGVVAAAVAVAAEVEVPV